jgi:O-antigen/teichoic acid export membrane protein
LGCGLRSPISAVVFFSRNLARADHPFAARNHSVVWLYRFRAQGRILGVGQISTWLDSPRFAVFTWPRFHQFGFSMADQALSVGGTFLVNLALARTQTKEEYGMFALSYSVYTFLAGLHNAAIVEPLTVHGSGRYRHHFSAYFNLMARGNVLFGLLLTAFLLLLCLLFRWVAPHLVSRSLVGLGLTVSILLSGVFLRRVFYLQRQAALAAKTSFIFFVTVTCGLWLTASLHVLDGLSVFLILAAGWIAAGFGVAGRLPLERTQQSFFEAEPDYWREHWKYARWVLITAFVFQMTSQGYYWLLAGFVSVKDVADLKAMLLLIGPVDQIYIALSYLVLPVLSSRYVAMNIRGLVSGWKWFFMLNFGIMGSFALFIRFFGKSVAHLMYAGRFDGVAPLLPTLALFPLIMGIGNTMAVALKAMERPQMSFYAYVASGATTLLAGFPLMVHFGLQGTTYGLLLSASAYTTTLGVAFLSTLQQRNLFRQDALTTTE